MPDGGASVGDVLTRYLERIERIQEEKRELAAQEREVFAQAKNAGFDPKVMRAILKERRMDPGDREEWQALLDTYRAALGMLGETPLGEAARRRFEKRNAPPEAKGEVPPNDAPAQEPPEAPEPAEAAPSPEQLAEAREQGAEAARTGIKVTQNPFPAGDARRASWDEGWCAASGSDGMDIPAAFRRSKPRKPGSETPPEGGEG